MYKPKRGMQTCQKLTIAIHMHISRSRGGDSMVSKGHHTLACMQQRACRQSGLACKGMSSYRATLPVASRRGRAPSRYSTMATDSPLVLIASRPHKFTCTLLLIRHTAQQGQLLLQAGCRKPSKACLQRGLMHAQDGLCCDAQYSHPSKHCIL